MARYSVRDSSRSAKRLALRYVSTEEPGYARRRCGRGFVFFHPGGTVVTQPALRAWLKDLPVPPAWTQVWICRFRNGHILATGRDAKARKVYLYHPDWRQHRSRTNFERLAAFGRALPAIRKRLDRDLRQRGLLRERVLAAAIHLMDVSHIRVGGEEYARDNRSFGITTLLDRHLELAGQRVNLSFRAKGGQLREISLTDPRLARVLRQCEDLPGQRLFQFVDDAGQRCAIDSTDINDYLREAGGAAFTAKDFRTWGGTVAALEYLMGQPVSAAEEDEVEQVVKACLEHAAEHLGNTLAITREHYVHPQILDAFRRASLPPAPRRRRCRLDPAESVVLKILKQKRR
ncbi:MAG: DNA topoisomerase IB [Gammaproteobacteria bacterium]|nr:DNA topoisomerase IB [Gammaproteobacteria bacterium]